MWTRVFAALVLFLIASFVIQALIPHRTRARKVLPRQSIGRDIAPVIGFFGATLLVLSFGEAVRREAIAAWGWGSLLGLLASVGVWIAMGYRGSRPAQEGKSTAHIVWRLARQYGVGLLFAILGLSLAVRVVGAALEIFVAGALGVLVIAMAVAVFASERQRVSRQ